MQLLCLLIFIGATQCDNSSESTTSISPDCFDNLGVPNAVEYVSLQTLSVQTSYITSVECMLSSNHYIQSGFSEIDSGSNDLETNLETKFKGGFSSLKNMILGLQQTDEEKLSQDKINAVVSMTTNYYQKKNVTVKKSETKLCEVTEVQQAQSILTARRCESSYIDFMDDVTTIKTKYTSGTSDSDNINTNQWTTLVKQYYEARETIVNKTNVYASIREAFLFGSGINLCEGSANTDQSLLKIYETDNLSTFFGRTDNDASELLSQTVTHMYTIYKASLTNIYLKSVVHSNSDLAMRVTIWEQVNLVRANFEYKSQFIVSFIKKTQEEAKSNFGNNNPKGHDTIMIALYTRVQEMLLTVVKSTEVHYKRALNFNPDGSMIKMNFNKYKVDIIEKYYEKIVFSINAHEYDIRIIEKNECPSPSRHMCIPQNLYSLVVNKFVFQTFICQLNYIDARIKTTQYDTKQVDSWIYEKITMVQFQNLIMFSKCTATENKIFIINSATYAYILLTTDKNTQSTDIKQIIDQSTTDIIGTLCVNTLEITNTFKTVKIFLDKYSSTNCTTIIYRPGQPSNSNTPPPNIGSPPLNNGNYPPNNGNYPPNNGNAPPNNGKSPPNNGNSPPNNGTTPNNGSPPSDNGNYPSNNGNYPSNNGNSPPNNGNSPPNNGNSPPNNGNSPNNGSPPSDNGNSPPNNGNSPPNNGNSPPNNGNSPPNNGNSPNNGSPPSDNGNSPNNGSPPPDNGNYPPNNGNYPNNNGSYPSTIGNNSQPGSPTNYNKYSFITSSKPITNIIEIIRTSSSTKLKKCLTNVQNTNQTDYTRVVIISLEICQKISQNNADYLDSITSDSINYVANVTTPGSQEYFYALIALYRDTSEKSKIMFLTMDIPLKRTATFSLTSNEYVYVAQTTECNEFVNNIYKHFEVNLDEIYNQNNDADSYLQNSIKQFNNIYETVVNAVKKTQDSTYKEFQLSYLKKTLAAYKQTTDCFKEQIDKSQQFISQSGDKSKYAFYKEITQRLDSMNIMYYGVLIKSQQYAKDTSSVSIFVSEFDVITIQTEIVRSYTITYTEKTAEVSIGVSN